MSIEIKKQVRRPANGSIEQINMLLFVEHSHKEGGDVSQDIHCLADETLQPAEADSHQESNLPWGNFEFNHDSGV
jgi:hypothetical protein